jgi:hypothetical protein
MLHSPLSNRSPGQLIAGTDALGSECIAPCDGLTAQAWERAVNLDVVNVLVDRATNEIRPKTFRMLTAITDKDDTDFQCGYAKASEWAVRHDQAPEINCVAPDPDELESELLRLKEWVKRIKGYRA